jgi:hypothetical protein
MSEDGKIAAMTSPCQCDSCRRTLAGMARLRPFIWEPFTPPTPCGECGSAVEPGEGCPLDGQVLCLPCLEADCRAAVLKPCWPVFPDDYWPAWERAWDWAEGAS